MSDTPKERELKFDGIIYMRLKPGETDEEAKERFFRTIMSLDGFDYLQVDGEGYNIEVRDLY